MPSLSCPRKNDSNVHCEHIARLLQDGYLAVAPSAEVLAAADHLRDLGIIDTECREFVKCANHEDADFPPHNRNCPGRIYLGDQLHESGGELRCPDCNRIVFPDHYSKRHFSELRVRVLRDGVMSFIEGLLVKTDLDVRRGGAGLLNLTVGDDVANVCVVDYCENQKVFSRDRAIQYPTCYVAVNARDFEARFLPEDWIHRVLLADVICGVKDIISLVRSAIQQGTPTSLRQASIPVCDKCPLPVVIEPINTTKAGRQFVVEVGDGVVRVEGVQVIAKQAGPRFIIFQTLWKQFLGDLQKGIPPDDFTAIPITDLMTALETRTDKRYPDETTVRRTINLLQNDIEKTLKKTQGVPIDREDVMQTCARTGQLDTAFGYRINPFTVTVRPYQPDISHKS